MKTLAATLLASAWLAIPALATDRPTRWNQFRGPAGSGLAPDDHPLPTEFGPAKNLLWKCELPNGHASPSIWGERIFVTGSTDRDVQTLCIDAGDGEILWREQALTDMFERRHRINSAATPSPTTDGERVFVYFGSCGLTCYDFDGNEVWLRRMRIPENMYGTATSPVLAGGHLVFQNDMASGSFLEAIDPATGKTVWKTERNNFTASWSTPSWWNNGDVEELLVYGVGWLTAYDLKDGSERWSVPGLTDEPCITPVTGDGLVFLTSYNMRTNPEVIGVPQFEDLLAEYDGDQDGELSYKEIRENESILSRFDADGEGNHPLAGFFRYLDQDRSGRLTSLEFERMHAFIDSFRHVNGLLAIRPGNDPSEMEIAWKHERGVPECPSPLYLDGRIYMVKNGGILSCLDAKTGALHYQSRLDAGGPYYASPVAGDGKVYTTSARGVITVIAAGDSLEILARNDLGERTVATPALVDGTIYVRTESHLYAFSDSTE